MQRSVPTFAFVGSLQTVVCSEVRVFHCVTPDHILWFVVTAQHRLCFVGLNTGRMVIRAPAGHQQHVTSGINASHPTFVQGFHFVSVQGSQITFLEEPLAIIQQVHDVLSLFFVWVIYLCFGPNFPVLQ